MWHLSGLRVMLRDECGECYIDINNNCEHQQSQRFTRRRLNETEKITSV